MLQPVNVIYLQLIYKGFWEWWHMMHVQVQEDFHHSSPGALVEDPVDRYQIAQHIEFTCICRGFIKGRAQGKLTACEHEFAWLFLTLDFKHNFTC